MARAGVKVNQKLLQEVLNHFDNISHHGFQMQSKIYIDVIVKIVCDFYEIDIDLLMKEQRNTGFYREAKITVMGMIYEIGLFKRIGPARLGEIFNYHHATIIFRKKKHIAFISSKTLDKKYSERFSKIVANFLTQRGNYVSDTPEFLEQKKNILNQEIKRLKTEVKEIDLLITQIKNTTNGTYKNS